MLSATIPHINRFPNSIGNVVDKIRGMDKEEIAQSFSKVGELSDIYDVSLHLGKIGKHNIAETEDGNGYWSYNNSTDVFINFTDNVVVVSFGEMTITDDHTKVSFSDIDEAWVFFNWVLTMGEFIVFHKHLS